MSDKTAHDPKEPKDARDAKDEPFEKTLARLEQTLDKLERSDLPLEDALSAYEEGLRLVKAAQGKLDKMDARLEQLLADGRTAPLKDPGAAEERKNR